ncbi:MAG: WhiB family transcriptional regulator [Mycobacteriaceae bacterium]
MGARALQGDSPLDDVLPDDVLPCRVGDADLWFAETPTELELAKALCTQCPVRLRCLRVALERAEPWGVWGGEIFDHGAVITRKRPRGRPRKTPRPEPVAASSSAA